MLALAPSILPCQEQEGLQKNGFDDEDWDVWKSQTMMELRTNSFRSSMTLDVAECEVYWNRKNPEAIGP